MIQPSTGKSIYCLEYFFLLLCTPPHSLADRRDAGNPTFRRVRLADVDISVGAQKKTMILEKGSFFVDMASALENA
jgi:hypothetical protein